MSLYTKFKHSKLTVCDELHRQGYLTDKQLTKDKKFGGETYSKRLIIAYRFIIWPIVLLMRCSKSVTHIVYLITKKCWLNKALS